MANSNRRARRGFLVCAVLAMAATSRIPAQIALDSIQVSLVPAGFPVGFDLLTRGDRQYLAYYDAGHNLVVASRKIDSAGFRRQILPTQVGWDSHNFVTMALDAAGHLHVAGNMHTSAMTYFRTTVAGDIGSLVKVPNLVSAAKENSATYPEFITTPAGVLNFFYRQGSSGNGVWYADAYDSRPTARTWSALYAGQPLFGSEGSVNAYFNGPVLGPDGRYHFVFMWRDTPDASTCHDIGYLRSQGPDLNAWENAAGEIASLPVVQSSIGIGVDPVPVKQGLINMSQTVGFDSQGRAVVSYHKYDGTGVSQVYNARWSPADKRWLVAQASAWKTYKWDFGGGGSIPSEISIGPVAVRNGKLVQSWHHAKFGSGEWVLDEATLKPTGAQPPPPPAPASNPSFAAAADADPLSHTAWEQGYGPDPTARYALHWRTLAANRDAKPDSVPPDSPLMLVKFRVTASGLVPARAAPGSRVPPARRRSGTLTFARETREGGDWVDGAGRVSPASGRNDAR